MLSIPFPWLIGFYLRVVFPAMVPVAFLLTSAVTFQQRPLGTVLAVVLWLGWSLFWAAVVFGAFSLARRLFLRLRKASEDEGRAPP